MLDDPLSGYDLWASGFEIICPYLFYIDLKEEWALSFLKLSQYQVQWIALGHNKNQME